MGTAHYTLIKCRYCSRSSPIRLPPRTERCRTCQSDGTYRVVEYYDADHTPDLQTAVCEIRLTERGQQRLFGNDERSAEA